MSRILGPIVSCLEQLAVLHEKDQHIKNLIDTGYGGLEKLKKDILFDFFRSAFDGSGADNFFDAGRYGGGFAIQLTSSDQYFISWQIWTVSRLLSQNFVIERGVTV